MGSIDFEELNKLCLLLKGLGVGTFTYKDLHLEFKKDRQPEFQSYEPEPDEETSREIAFLMNDIDAR